MSDKAADPWRLDRFVAAQDQGGTYQRALAELRAGAKASHWMWFVFPQIAGLGQSPTSRRYAIASLDEARAYVAHPVLGPRLIECARILRARGTDRAGHLRRHRRDQAALVDDAVRARRRRPPELQHPARQLLRRPPRPADLGPAGPLDGLKDLNDADIPLVSAAITRLRKGGDS